MVRSAALAAGMSSKPHTDTSAPQLKSAVRQDLQCSEGQYVAQAESRRWKLIMIE